MSTSRSASLSEPTGNNKISQGTLGYICARHRQRQYDLVIKEFKRSNITQKQLADRLGKGQDVISRLLARPRNWEADTFAELMFGISGAIPAYRVEHPFRRHSAISKAATGTTQPISGRPAITIDRSAIDGAKVVSAPSIPSTNAATIAIAA